MGCSWPCVGLRDPDLGAFAETLWGDPLPPSRLKPLIPLLSIAPLVPVVTAMTGKGPWFLVVATVILNMVIHFVQYRRLDSFPFVPLGTLLGTAVRIQVAPPSGMSPIP